MLTLATASTIIDAALAHAREAVMKPLAVVVLDTGGHLIVAKREDNASLFRMQIAQAKAHGALGMGFGSRALVNRVPASPQFYNGLMALTGAVVPSPGGVLIRDANGTLVGAIGISGDTGDADETAALAGIAAASLVAQPAD